MKKAVFLDRDGVINRKAPEGEYVTRWEDMEFLAGASEAIHLLNEAGYFVVVVSNQRCVAKGLITNSELDSMHVRMRREFELAGARIDDIFYCPHDFKPPCTCRKPQPGMLLEAARKHELELDRSWMIGDSEHDVLAGKMAGCRTVRLIQNGEGQLGGADLYASSLLDAVRKVLSTQAGPHKSSSIPG